MRYFARLLPAVFVIATSCVQSAKAQQQWQIVNGASHKVSLTCTGVFTGSSEKVTDLVLYAPIPPNIPGQSDTNLKVVVKGALESTSKDIPELSDQHRLFKQTLIHTKGPVTVNWIYSATLTERRVVTGSTRSIAPISAENGAQSQRTVIKDKEIYDLDSSAYQGFFRKYGLAKHSDESIIDFEWRNFHGIRSIIHYKSIDGQSHRLSYLLGLPALETDCGGFSIFGVANSLANGIEARTRNGRWIIPGSKDNTDYHVQYDFFDPQSNDWWITDATVSQNNPDEELPKFFGNWQANFLTLMTGTNAKVNSLYSGIQTITWGQSPVWWYHGSPYTSSFSWKAEIIPPSVTGLGSTASGNKNGV